MAGQEDGIETEVLADEVIVSAVSEAVIATDGGGVDGAKVSDVSVEGLDINTPLDEAGSTEVIRGVEQSETTVDTTMRLGPGGSDLGLVEPESGGVSVGVEVHESIISASKDVDKGLDLGWVVPESIGVSVGVEVQKSLISASKDVGKGSDLGSVEPESNRVSVGGVDVQGSLTSTPKNVDTELDLGLVEHEKNKVSTDVHESLISASKDIVTGSDFGLVDLESNGISVDANVHESHISTPKDVETVQDFDLVKPDSKGVSVLADVDESLISTPKDVAIGSVVGLVEPECKEVSIDRDVHESLIGTSKDIETGLGFDLVEPENNGVSVGADAVKDIDTNNGDIVNPRTEAVHVDSDVEIDEETEGHDTVDCIEEHDFSVGDIVWGKVKSHPWWPGQIYDSANASNEAMKYKPKNRLLVAYYGDSTFAWCLPSQLIPFVENFNTMSKQNGTKNFINAVTEAVDVINRLVDLSMICPCVPESNRKGLITKAPVVNAGISSGVIALEGVIGKQLSLRYNPSELLATAAVAAKTVSFSSILELSILKGWLSSFYRAKGGFSLARYHDPILIEGLEDKSKTGNIGAANVSVRGPVEEQYTRKHRSVAELIGSCIDTTPKNRNSANKKRKANEEHGSCSNMNQDCPTRRKQGRKHTEYDVNSEEKLPESSKQPRESLKVDILVENNDKGSDGKRFEEKFSPRERKKSKYLSLPYTSPPSRVGYPSYKHEEKESERITQIARVGERMTKAAVQLLDSTPLKSNDESEKEHAPIVYSREKTVKSAPLITKTGKKDEKNSIIDAKVEEVLSGLKSLATGLVSSLNANMLELTKAFKSEFRSSIYLNGSHHETYQKRFNSENRVKGLIQMGKKRGREPEKLEKKLDTPKPKRQTRCSSTKKSNNDDDLEVPLASSIVLTFDSDFNLPLKGDIIERFSDFGDINEDETEVFLESCSVKIVYLNKGCVEEALKASLCGKPFFSGIVDYKLCYRQKV